MRDDILIGDTPKARRRRGRLNGVQSAGRLWKHFALADIDGLVTAEWLAQASAGTLVRNPWDRLVSYYVWLRAQRFDHPAVALAARVDFGAFLRDPGMQAAIRAGRYGHYKCDSAGQERFQLFIRLEAFEQDAAPLWGHLGFRLDLPLVNASSRAPDYPASYTSDLARLAESLCEEDITRFGYRY